MKTIYFSSDHAGHEMRLSLIGFVEGLGYTTEDLGPTEYDESDDYPDFIAPIAAKISSIERSGKDAFGIILGGSGQGEAIVANRFSGVRAGVFNCENLELVTLLREHNDANILSIGSRFVGEAVAEEAVKLFLETEFSHEERHERRIKEIDMDCR
jgi:ribose 5-phosphate isomerase B